MSATPQDDPLVTELVAQLRETRDAERELFAALDPAVRDRPMRRGDWSPKDHQAHLTAWKVFRLRPDLAEFAKQDPDLHELRDELTALVA